MGWTGHNLPEGGKLFTRGGFCGVYVEIDGIEVPIPERLLWKLAAMAIRNERISRLEQTTDVEILGLEGTPLGERLNEDEPE